MPKHLKYKDLIRNLQPFENDDVVMVAAHGYTSFFTQDGMVCIARLYEFTDNDGNVKVTTERPKP